MGLEVNTCGPAPFPSLCGVTSIATNFTMKATARLLQHTARITLFTRANCSLCDTAKAIIAGLEKKRNFDYSEIDVMAAGQKQWKDAYQFDTPVV